MLKNYLKGHLKKANNNLKKIYNKNYLKLKIIYIVLNTI